MEGHIIHIYSEMIDLNTNNMVELHALNQGLRIALQND